MGRVFSKGAHATAEEQPSAAGGLGRALRRAVLPGGHGPAGSASELPARRPSHAAGGLHRRGEKVIKKKNHIPKIVITGPLEDSASLQSVDDLPQTQTIRDVTDSGPYQVHRQPSTVEAYGPRPEAAQGLATTTGT